MQFKGEAMQHVEKVAVGDAPEWASRLVTINETCHITGEARSTIYRKINAGIYPGLVHFGGSARLRGWELWRLLKGEPVREAA